MGCSELDKQLVKAVPILFSGWVPRYADGGAQVQHHQTR